MSKPVKKGRIIKIAAISLAAAAAVIAGIFFLISGNGDPVNVYNVIDVGMDSYWGDNSETEGVVRMDNMQSVYLSETQTVKRVYVKEGQEIKKGEKIAEFDTTLSELELDRQRIMVSKLEERLKAAQNELVKIKSYKPYVPSPAPKPAPKKELDPVDLPYKIGGSGTESDPLRFLWDDDCWYSEGFIDGILPKKAVPVTPSKPDEPDEPIDPDDPDELVDPGEDDGQAESADTPDDSEGGEPEPDDPGETEYSESSKYVVFEVREYNNPKGELLRYWGMHFVRKSDGGFRFSMFDPVINDDGGYDDGGGYSDNSSGYTAAEIAEMRKDKEKEIKDTALQIKVERVKCQKMELEFNSGVITADVDGVVKTVRTEDEARDEGAPIIVVSGGGGYYISGTLSELELDTVNVGQTVQVNSWMTGMQTEGEITEISDYPTTGGYSYSAGNRNVSYYPFTVFVNEDASLQEGEYVGITYSAGDVSGGIYLSIPFVLNENSKSYVYVANDKDRLEKREVVTGKTVWNSYVEIISGIGPEDHIAFPYGKEVKEGAKVKYASPEDLYQMY
ncbi:MAG: HlyD family efflux transporter periplasmic adaptor subunit [Oscillospiraceae bacterium]|nr:HlyD family efflux transporter periplasmic adaptor subunit [Oscillospiraceae bacterium]